MAYRLQNNLKQYNPIAYHSNNLRQADKGYSMTLFNIKRGRKITRKRNDKRVYNKAQDFKSGKAQDFKSNERSNSATKRFEKFCHETKWQNFFVLDSAYTYHVRNAVSWNLTINKTRLTRHMITTTLFMLSTGLIDN